MNFSTKSHKESTKKKIDLGLLRETSCFFVDEKEIYNIAKIVLKTE
jgi:hypothetical protein